MSEKVRISKDDGMPDEEAFYTDWFDCPHCQLRYIFTDAKFCPMCGREIEWVE